MADLNVPYRTPEGTGVILDMFHMFRIGDR